MVDRDAGVFKIALAQLSCSPNPGKNILSATRAVQAAARRGAELCVLPELFTNRYLGQFDDVSSRLKGVPHHESVLGRFTELAKELSLALVVPFAEFPDPTTCHNSIVLVDGEGAIQARYRKTHIPDAEGYREGLYFRAGDLGYTVASLGPIRLGLAICWDQWFPEVSRILALRGAQLIIYPSAIGSEVHPVALGDDDVEPDFDSRPAWELVMRAQAIMTGAYVAAVNRVGQEERIRFYGGSFVADPWGRVLKRGSTTRPGMIYATLDLSRIAKADAYFEFYKYRNPAAYADLTSPASDLTRPAGEGVP